MTIISPINRNIFAKKYLITNNLFIYDKSLNDFVKIFYMHGLQKNR
jgi:hypothetical protein